MVKVKEVRRILNATDYKVKVEKLHEGCIVRYPNKIHSYTLTDSGFIFSDENSKSYIYRVESYAIRVGISVHIMRLCHEIGFHPRLLEYYIGEKRVKSMESVLPLIGNLKEERIVCGIVQAIIKGGHEKYWLEEADSMGVKEVCQAIIDIWEDR